MGLRLRKFSSPSGQGRTGWRRVAAYVDEVLHLQHIDPGFEIRTGFHTGRHLTCGFIAGDQASMHQLVAEVAGAPVSVSGTVGGSQA